MPLYWFNLMTDSLLLLREHQNCSTHLTGNGNFSIAELREIMFLLPSVWKVSLKGNLSQTYNSSQKFIKFLFWQSPWSEFLLKPIILAIINCIFELKESKSHTWQQLPPSSPLVKYLLLVLSLMFLLLC